MNNEYSIRLANHSDIAILYEWANDPAVRSNALNRERISWEEHVNWFSNKMTNERSTMLILTKDGTPVGQVRFDSMDELFLIDYSIETKHRGKGLGSRIVNLGIDFLKHKITGSIRLRAEVLASNEPSVRVFEGEKFCRIEKKLSEQRLFIIFEKIV